MRIFGTRKEVEVKALEDIKRNFEFLITDFSYQLVAITSPFFESDGSRTTRHVCYYRNEKSRLQLEIVGSEDFFLCVLRRFSYGTPSPYSDTLNSFRFKTLAKIEKDYDDKKYITMYAGWDMVLQNTADLMKRHKTFFVTEQNDETDLFEQLKQYAHKNNLEFNDLWEGIEDPFFKNLKQLIAPVLIGKGFHLLRESSALPPFDLTKMVDFVVYQKGKTTIKITQEDWRDAPYIYLLSKNNRLIFELDLKKQPDKEYGTKQMVEHLKEYLQT